MHYTAPHAPWRQEEQPLEVWQLYDGCDFPSVPLDPPHPWGGWDPTPEQRRETLQGYCTTITAMDAAVGRLLDKLTALGIREDTLVFFTSDNGYNMGHHGITGKGNGTYPMNMYEESVKVPFIANCPGRIPAGVVNADLVSHYDFMPTILDCVGLENPEADKLPGRSFAPLLKGDKLPARDSVVVYDEYGPVRMIRDERWKYVHRYGDMPCELYDLAEDPGENSNRVDDGDCAAIVKEMRSRLDEWFARYVDPERGGAVEPVTGRGQIDLCGKAGQGRRAFEGR